MLALSILTTLLASVATLGAAAPAQPSLDQPGDLTTDLSQYEIGGSDFERRQTSCPRYEVISARGTGESQSSPRGNAGTVRGILAAVPGGRNYEVVYGATSNFATGPATGARDLISRVTTVRRTCPDTKFVFVGYSQGAMVVVTAENDGGLPQDSVAAAILYGSPYWLPNRPENAGSARSGRGIAAFGSGNTTPSSYQGKTQDVCNTGDNICTGSGSIAAHLGYSGSASERAAVEFAAGKLNAALGGSTPTNPTQPPTCTC
ncbi:hypothetical protein FFLO_02262 [Filobasidium floriforme]|uniref:Cutinase n=1 Tax=Filobasidium floriforme TaxID=5210 RepID=A0A8K0JMW7_9TREE|nr:hypothetical protein FFLO_02262 [Filobasidium floriforme]